MGEALLSGVLAGLAVAVPLGAIGVLIVELAATHGFRTGWAAGLGTATADLFYGAAAAFAGGAAVAALSAVRTELRIAGGLVLLAVALHGLGRARRVAGSPPARAPRAGGRTYATFLGLTAINPLTIVIFASIVAGLPEIASGGLPAKLAFVVGVGGASALWQTALAGGGSVLGRAGPRARLATTVVGHLIVLGLAVRMLVT